MQYSTLPRTHVSPPTMTRRRRVVLQAAYDGHRKRGFPASIRELGEAVGLSSSSTIHTHLIKLEQLGMLVRNPSSPRSIHITPKGLRELGEPMLSPVPPSVNGCCALCGQTMPVPA